MDRVGLRKESALAVSAAPVDSCPDVGSAVSEDLQDSLSQSRGSLARRRRTVVGETRKGVALSRLAIGLDHGRAW